MTVTTDMTTEIPEHVLFQTLDGSAAVLNMETEHYYGLDAVGTQIWKALETTDTVGSAIQSLLSHYEVDAEQLRQDTIELINGLVSAGLLIVTPSE